MEQIIAGVLEKTLVGGAFLFLLYHNNVTLAKSVQEISRTLTNVSKTMNRMDTRMAQVEKDVEILKGVSKE